MKFLIWGAGGIGAYYGARLLSAGHDVVLVARGPHLTAMQSRGLRVVHEELLFDQAVTALSFSQLVQDHCCAEFDALLLTLKANGIAPLLAEAGAWLKSGTCPVISLQNGVDSEGLLASALDVQRVVGGLAVRIGGHVVAPGVVEARGPGQLIIGPWPEGESQPQRLADLAALGEHFNAAHIPTTVTAAIRYELWRKLLINNGVNPLSALTGLDTRSLTRHPEFGPIVYGLMQETARAANHDGVALNQQDVDEMFELISSFAAIKTSMLVDREAGRPLELDAICGAVLQRCRKAGERAPYTELVAALLHAQSGEKD